MDNLVRFTRLWIINNCQRRIDKADAALKVANEAYTKGCEAQNKTKVYLHENHYYGGPVNVDQFLKGTRKVEAELAKLDHKFSELNLKRNRKVASLRRSIAHHQNAMKEGI